MKKNYLLKGLVCPHCSAEIELETGKLKNILSSEINLINQTLTVTYLNYTGDMLDDITKIVHSHEPDVEVSEITDKEKPKTNYSIDKKEVIRLSVSAIVYAAAMILSAADFSEYIKISLFVLAYIIAGGDVVVKAVGNILKGHVFDESFLMTVSSVGAFAIGEYPEAAAVMIFYQIGEFFQELAVNRSRRSISELIDIRPDFANVKRENDIVTVSPEDVKIGEYILVKAGEKIPLDGIVVDGRAMLDTSAITGESVPRNIKKGDTALSGCINTDGAVTIEVTKSFSDSIVSKIVDMIENASGKKSQTENFITVFSRKYTPVVVILAVMLAVLPPLIFALPFSDWIRRGCVFLAVSCPCALVISVPLTFFGGIGKASKSGILIKGSNYLDALTKLETVVTDKTGTLTKGVFEIQKIVCADNTDESMLIEYAAKGEALSNHPIAQSVARAYKGDIDISLLSDYTEISGEGVCVTENSVQILVGNEKLMKRFGIKFNADNSAGTKVYVAADGKYLGTVIISDELKSDAKAAVKMLKKQGIKNIVMLTGDNESSAKSTAEELGTDKYYANLLPNQKLDKLEEIIRDTAQKTAFVGDGINDAPALARADIGIAMGALGSDAAIEAADIVLMNDEPSKIAEAVKIAKATKAIALQNITFALGVKIIFMILGAFGVIGIQAAVFADVGVMLLAVLNAMRIQN